MYVCLLHVCWGLKKKKALDSLGLEGMISLR